MKIKIHPRNKRGTIVSMIHAECEHFFNLNDVAILRDILSKVLDETIIIDTDDGIIIINECYKSKNQE